MQLRRTIKMILFAMLASAGQAFAQWEALGGPWGASVNDLDRAPDGTLYLASNLSLFKSVDNADSWQKVVPETPAAIEFDQVLIDGTDLYSLRYSAFYKSTDGGLNWVQQSADGFSGANYVLQFGPDNYFAVYGWGGLYISKDKGVTWTKVLSKQPHDVEATPSGDLYVAAYVNEIDPDGQILRYKYPGAGGVWDPAGWEQIYTNDRAPGEYRLLILPSGTIYAAVVSDVITSTTGDAGTWTSIKDRIVLCDFYGVAWGLSPGGTILFTTNCSNRIYFSSDDGLNWTSVSSPADTYGGNIFHVTYATESTFFLGSGADGVFRTTDGGSTWLVKSNGLTTGEGRSVKVSNNGRILYIDGNGGKGYWTSADNGSTWSFSILPDWTNRVAKLSDGKILLHSGPGVYRSDDDGTSFTRLNETYVNAIVEDENGQLFAAASEAFYSSSDQGTTWLAFTVTGLPAQYFVDILTIDNAADLLFAWLRDAVTGRNVLYKISATSGIAALVTEEPWLDDQWENVGNIFFADNTLYVAENNQFYASADGGASWTTISFSGERVFPITGGLCVSRRGLLYITQDGGKSWHSTALPDNNTLITDIAAVSDGFVASASGSRALKFTGNLILFPAELPPFIDFNWQPMDGPYGGNVRGIFTDNSNNTYALSDNALYKTSTFTGWDKLATINGAVHDGPSNAIYAVNHNELLKSLDEGITWSRLDNESNISCRSNLVKCANGDLAFFASCPTAAIYVSTDGGSTLGAAKYLLNNQGFMNIVTTSATSALFLLLHDRGLNKNILLRSTDRGSTWTEVTVPLQNPTAVSADATGSLYILESNLNIFRSGDDGNSWSDISGDPNNGYFFNNMIFISDGGEVFVGGYNNNENGNGLYKTADGGVTWTFLPTGLVTQAMHVSGTRMMAGTSKGLFVSDDEGVTFTERSNGIHSQISGLELISPSKLAALDGNNNSFATSDFQTWTRTDLSARQFLRNPDGSLIAYWGQEFYKSIDDGENWFSFGTSGQRLQEVVTADGKLYFGTSGTGILYTEDFQTWNDLPVSGLPTAFDFISIAANALGTVFVIVNNHSTTREVYQIRFGSAIRFSQPSNPQNLLYSDEDDKVILYDGNGLIYETSDGSAWTTRVAPSGNKLMITEKNYLFIGTHGGALWLSRDEGKTWQSVGLTYYDDVGFDNIVINEFNGYAYGSVYKSVIHKSANIIIPEETTAPAVTALAPVNNETSVSLRPALSVTFDEAVAPVAGRYVRILDVANPLAPVAVMEAVSGVQHLRTFTFTPAGKLDFNKSYFVIIDNGAFTDIFGNDFSGISSNAAWRFTTKSPPTIVSTNPPTSGTNISLNPDLTVTFTEPMFPVNGKKLFLYDAADTSTPVVTVGLLGISPQFASLIPQGASSLQSVTVRFDARIGGKELMGVSKVYMHAGIVERNTTDPVGGNGGDWRYEQGNWGRDDGVGEMTRVPGESDVWQITLTPSLRAYFGVPAATSIYYVALKFRNAYGNQVATPPATLPGGVVWNKDVFLAVAQTGSTVCSTAPVQSGNTLLFPICETLQYSKQYFVKFEDNAFATSDGGVLSFLNNNSDWVFTTVRPPDVLPPSISYQSADFVKGAVNKLQITVTDNAEGSGVNSGAVKVLYRGISSSGAFNEASLTAAASNIFEVTVADSWMDEFGLEFKFEARDLDGNIAYSPPGPAIFHQQYISYAEADQSLPSSVLSFGGKLSNYRIFSIPYELADKLISTVFNELGTPDRSLYRILTYDGNDQYLEYPSSLSTIDRGVGYWINIRDQVSLPIENASAPENSKEDLFSLTLKSGWNQIGNPYPFTISWTEVRKVNTKIGVLKTFNGTSFVNDDKMNPFEGGFVFYDSPSNTQTSIDIPFSARTTPGGREKDTEPDFTGGWFLPMRIRNEMFVNDLCGIGMHPDASPGFDEFDDVSLPAFFGYPEIRFPHEDHISGKFTRDIVPDMMEFTWEFTLASPEGSPVIEWDRQQSASLAKELYLLDVGTQRLIDMVEENQYFPDPRLSRKFRIYFGIDRNFIPPSRIALTEPYPNPAPGVSKINFSLPEGKSSSYHVSLEVYDMMGKKIATVAKGMFEAGFYEAAWDPAAAGNGVYLYRLSVLDSGDHYLLTQKLFVSK